MSYTIQSTPPALSSVHGDLIYTVAYPEHTADAVTYPNFKYVADIYVGGTMVTRLRKVPHPDTSIGVFNVGQVVRNYIAATFNPGTGAIAQTLGAGEFFISVQLKFGEEYGYDTYTNLVVDSSRTFFNNYNSRLAGSATSLNGYTDKVISSRPLVNPLRCDSVFNFIPYLPSNTTLFSATVRMYNYADFNYQTYAQNVTPSVAYELQLLNFSPAVINALYPGAVTDYTKYFTVELGGVVYRFNLNCDCIHDTYTLHFLNKFGGFESKDFTKVSRRTIQIEKKEYGRLPYSIDSSGVVSYYNSNKVYNESRSVFSSMYKEKMLLNSDLLTDAEYSWLEQLVLSPMVFLEMDSYFFPVVITETNYEPKKLVNDGFTNLTINIEFGEQQNTQFR